ncbi:MAG: hypothetical protein ACR2KA_01475 [Opitutales bacterium]
MTKLSAFWQTHRLGMFYGFLWAIVVTFILVSSYTLFGMGKTDGSFVTHSFHNLLNPKLLINVIATIIIGPIVTAIMRRSLKNSTFKGALWRGALSLLIASVFFGLISGQLDVLWRKMDGTDFGYTSIGALWYAVTFPFWAFTLFAPLLIPLACLNTWHLWKVINRHPHGADLQGHVA